MDIQSILQLTYLLIYKDFKRPEENVTRPVSEFECLPVRIQLSAAIGKIYFVGRCLVDQFCVAMHCNVGGEQEIRRGKTDRDLPTRIREKNDLGLEHAASFVSYFDGESTLRFGADARTERIRIDVIP